MSDQPDARPLPKHRTTQTQNKHIHTLNIHALNEIQTHDPSVRASEDSSCLRRRGYCGSHVSKNESGTVAISAVQFVSELEATFGRNILLRRDWRFSRRWLGRLGYDAVRTADVYGHFGGTSCLRLQGTRILRTWNVEWVYGQGRLG
jgi:hypothetical protein